MKDCKFKQLVLDVYEEWQKPERTFEKIEFGHKLAYNNFWGTLYNPISTDCFSDITDINRYMDISNPDMLMLRSRVTGQEVEIYSFQLEHYRIDGNKLVLIFKNKEVIFEM